MKNTQPYVNCYSNVNVVFHGDKRKALHELQKKQLEIVERELRKYPVNDLIKLRELIKQ